MLKSEANAVSVLDDYKICKSNGFGRSLLVCDVNNTLALRTQKKLTLLLNELQQKVKCKCEHGCQRTDGNNRYIGVLLVTNSTKILNSNETLNKTAQKIYEDIELGNIHCDGGLFIIYIKDKNQLAIYHHNGSLLFLNTREQINLRRMAITNKLSYDSLALQYLLSNYESVQRAEAQQNESWMSILGLLLALSILLLILALLLALFLARFCCCCARREKYVEEIYQTSTLGRSKIIEPIMVATSIPEQIYATQTDAIYSTPYSGIISGTPIPPPHLSSMRADNFYPGSSVRGSSQAATPTSTKKHRIRPSQGQVSENVSPSSILAENTASNKVDDSTQTNGRASLDDVVEVKRLDHANNSVPWENTSGNKSSRQVAETSSTQQRTTANVESDLSFLDPRRQQEVQTCTDFIY
ncbi:unnamed protein product [Thelazia callipaeda]|uniref:Cadherin domain-containing protein n=1 Tax=Thelazia callipaeda TaxID=103827 RepID=A0A0N5CY85_THECL|nr:unnamed protein product [Thelazia callipaeda]